MKTFKKYLSVMLVLAICLVSLPVTLTSVSADAAETKNVIFQFEPGKTRQSVGHNVTIWDGPTAYNTYVRKDADGYYYSTEIGSYSGQQYMSYDTGWNSSSMPLLANNAAMNALTPYMEISLDVRVVSENPGFSNNSLKIDVGSYDTVSGGIFWYHWGVYAQTDGGWHTYTKTEASNSYSGGILSKITYIINDVPENCKVEVRNFKASVKESDRAAINTALAGTGFTYDSITSYHPYVYKSVKQNIMQVTPEKTNQSGNGATTTYGWMDSQNTTVIDPDDQSGKYYSISYEDGIAGHSYKQAFVNTGWNFQTNAPAWTHDQALISALIPYMQVSVDVRVVSEEGNENFPISFQMHAFDWWDVNYGASTRNFHLVPPTVITADSGWQTITSEASGSIDGNGIGSFNIDVDIDNNSDDAVSAFYFNFKNLLISLKESDEDEINEVLKDLGYTFAQLTDFNTFYDVDTVIWYADSKKADQVINDNGNVSFDIPDGTATWQLTKAYDTSAEYNSEDGSYYHTVMSTSGNGGPATNTLIESGISSTTRGYGWLTNLAVLNALRPYMNVGLQYRATNGGGSNYSITLRPVNGDRYAVRYGEICDNMTEFTTANLNQWSEKDYGTFTHNFTNVWTGADFSVSIYNYDGNLAGQQQIDIRDLNIALASENRERINAALSKIEGIDNITNFTAGITLDTDMYGNKDYFSLLSSSANTAEYDANDDGVLNILDLVASKKYAANGFTPTYVLNRIDYDDSGEIDAPDLGALVSALLTNPFVRNDFEIGLATDHPGVAEMDADYTMTIKDKSGNSLNTNDFVWTANSDAVTITGAVITVPYGIRMSSRDLVVTATSKTNSSLYGTYTFNFQKFASNPAFVDEFDGDSVDTVKWTVTGSASVANGKLSLTPATNNARSGLNTDGKYTQTYGSFNARMKIPTSDAASALTAFWLMDPGAYYIDPNFPNNTQGEIDIAEYISKYDTYMSSVHWNGYITQDGRLYNAEDGDYYMRSYRFTDVTSNNEWYVTDDVRIGMNPGLNVEDDQFHDISAVWTKDGIYFYFDGRLISVHTGQGVGQNSAHMYMQLDYTGLASEELLVDYVKVYGII